MVRSAVHAWAPTSRIATERAWRRRLKWDLALAACVSACRPSTMVVDVGAADGVYALAMRSIVGQHGHVLAVEPNAASFSQLRRRLWRSGIDLRQVALSDSQGQATLSVPMGAGGPASPGLGTLVPVAGQSNTQTVNLLDMDTLLSEFDREISVVKIDVEGWEHMVLAGATRTLEVHRPTLIVEIEERHLNHQGLSVEDVVASITDHGFSVEPLAGGPGLDWTEFDPAVHQREEMLASGMLDQYINNFRFTPI